MKLSRYYLDRDARAWKTVFEDAGFVTAEEYQPVVRPVDTLAEATRAEHVGRFDVTVCIGILNQAACLAPDDIPHLQPHQRVSIVPGAIIEPTLADSPRVITHVYLLNMKTRCVFVRACFETHVSLNNLLNTSVSYLACKIHT